MRKSFFRNQINYVYIFDKIQAKPLHTLRLLASTHSFNFFHLLDVF